MKCIANGDIQRILWGLLFVLLSYTTYAKDTCLKPNIPAVDIEDISCAMHVIAWNNDNAQSDLEDSYAVFKQDNFFGVADLSGTIVIPAKYQELGSQFVDNLIPAKKDNKWGYVDIDGKEVIPLVYDRVPPFFANSQLADVEVKGKSGCIDMTGKIIVPISYDVVSGCEFHSGFKAGAEGQWLEVGRLIGDKYYYGCIDKKATTIVPIKYTSGICNFGKSALEIPNKFGNNYSEAIDPDTNLRGLINKSGNVIIPVEFDRIQMVNSNKIQVYKENKTFYLTIPK